jgi:hypothetical protein
VPFTLTANDPSIFVQGEPHDPEFLPVDPAEPDVSFVEADKRVGSIRRGARPPGIDRRSDEAV